MTKRKTAVEEMAAQTEALETIEPQSLRGVRT